MHFFIERRNLIGFSLVVILILSATEKNFLEATNVLFLSSLMGCLMLLSLAGGYCSVREPHKKIPAVQEKTQTEAALQEALRVSELRLQTMIENMPLAVVFVDGERTHLNRAAEELTGYSREELPTRDIWFPAVYGHRAGAMRSLYEQNRATGFLIDPIVPIFHKNGEERRVQFFAYADASGEMWMMYDLTERMAAEEALKVSEERWQLALKGNNDGIWDWNQITNEVFFSTRWKEMLGCEAHEVADNFDSWASRVHHDDLPSAMEKIQDYLQGKTSVYSYEHRMRHKDGSWVWILTRGMALFGEDGKPYRMTGSHTDITLSKQAEDSLRKTQERLQVAQRVARMGSWEYDLGTEVVTLSEEMFHILGLDPAQREPDYATILALFTPEDAALLNALIYRAATDGIEYELDLRRAPAEEALLRWFHAVGRPVRNADGQIIQLVGTLQDITERRQAQQQLEAAYQQLEAQLARINEQTFELEAQKSELQNANQRLTALSITDGLTGLNNHRAFQERLAAEFERTQRYKTTVSVLLLDVDKFKTYNDTFGHPQGDVVLRTVAQLLRQMARDTDYVCRYGGEEFVIVLPETDAQAAGEAAERFRTALEKHPWTLRPVTASFGVATLHADLTTAQELIAQADKALYASKERGRNQTTHFADIAFPAEVR